MIFHIPLFVFVFFVARLFDCHYYFLVQYTILVSVCIFRFNFCIYFPLGFSFLSLSLFISAPLLYLSLISVNPFSYLYVSVSVCLSVCLPVCSSVCLPDRLNDSIFLCNYSKHKVQPHLTHSLKKMSSYCPHHLPSPLPLPRTNPFTFALHPQQGSSELNFASRSLRPPQNTS